jgi:[acyl-carrier-protein] S-malonyltransferase
MGKNLYENFSIAKEVFEEANNVLGFDLKKLCFEGNIQELTKTENTQPAILAASVAAYKVFIEEFGIVPEYAAGHSLGEFSALACAEAIKFSDAVQIVKKRGIFMQQAVGLGDGAMAAVSGIDKTIIEEECRNISTNENLVVVSNYNSPDQIVVSGHKDAVDKVTAIFTEKGGRVTPLKVSAPFHSPLMQVAANNLKEELEKYSYNTFKYPVISNVTAKPYLDKGTIIENLTEQIVKPVQWQASMEYLQKQGVTQAIELGPQTVLRNLMKKNAQSITAYSYDDKQDLQAIKSLYLTSKEDIASRINDDKPNILTKCIAVAVCTKNSNWDNAEYQKGVVEPYRKIKDMNFELEQSGKKPSVEQMNEALEMLKSVFNTKKTPIEERIERFNEIFMETGTKELFSDFNIE